MKFDFITTIVNKIVNIIQRQLLILKRINNMIMTVNAIIIIVAAIGRCRFAILNVWTGALLGCLRSRFY